MSSTYTDVQIKTIQAALPQTIGGTRRLVSMLITEKDIIDLEFKKSGNTKLYRVYGELIKIGVDQDTDRKYFTILSYEYVQETNVFKVYLDEIYRVVNINHTGNPYAFGPVYSPDESVILIKEADGVVKVSKDGESWVTICSDPSGQVMKDSFYNKCKAQGFTGTEDELAAMVVELCRHKDQIPIVETDG